MSNTFGTLFRITTFGESHGTAMGGVIDGCPAGLHLDIDQIQHELDRRKPGQSRITSQRKESDTVQFLSGIFEGTTLGTPIGFVVPNEDQKSNDYTHIKDQYRPSHADYTYEAKYGRRDYRGGGRSSARETVCRVVAGAIAKQLLAPQGVTIHAYVHRVKDIEIPVAVEALDLSRIDASEVRCPHPETAQKMYNLIDATRKAGDTVGGSIGCMIKGVPAGWGEPVFNKLHAALGNAMLSINAVKAFEIGSGFQGTYQNGSAHNDRFEMRKGKVGTATNNSGGIQGGISNGEDIHFRVGFKPVATLMRDQTTITNKGEMSTIKGKGRHDPCVLPRAVPIVDAMAALVLADMMLLARTNKL